MRKTILYSLLGIIAAGLTAGCCDTKQAGPEEVRNVIYMIGDGMGVAQVTAYMIENRYEPIHLDRAQTVGLVKTYSANNRVTDSAAAGTALATGSKTDNGVLGKDTGGNEVTSIMRKAQDKGFGSGIVITSYMTDATPGAFYAHVDNRGQHEDIAGQLVESGIDVFMGGGARPFKERSDDVDLTEILAEKGYAVAHDFEEFATITEGKAAGLFAPSYMPLVINGRTDYLPRATAKALEILTNNDKEGRGFIIMVEGSQIDVAGHANDYESVIAEMKEFDDAVGVAFDYADRNPGTLVVVLADHETGGLGLVPGDADFSKAESGVNGSFTTGGHSAVMIPMFAYGTGAENFSGVFDNTDIPKIIEGLLLGQ